MYRRETAIKFGRKSCRLENIIVNQNIEYVCFVVNTVKLHTAHIYMGLFLPGGGLL